jgi:hypothetical protein
VTAVRALLAEAARHGIRFQVVGDRIEYEAPRHPPAELLERLRAHREELLALLAAAPCEPHHGRLRVVVDAIEPHPGPIRRAPWLVILQPERCIRADLASLARVVGGLADARQVGDWHGVERFEDERDDLLERLAACGARVRLVEVEP